MTIRLLVVALAALLTAAPTLAPPSVNRTDPGAPPPALSTAQETWSWPVRSARIARPYVVPAHAFGPGHRGIDLVAEPGEPVIAPAAGTVAFAGTVVDRIVLTLDHGDGLVSTLEPVADPVAVGTTIAAGDTVAFVGAGGHVVQGLHLGVRLHGEYINPMLLLGGIPRAVLLPCC